MGASIRDFACGRRLRWERETRLRRGWCMSIYARPSRGEWIWMLRIKWRIEWERGWLARWGRCLCRGVGWSGRWPGLGDRKQNQNPHFSQRTREMGHPHLARIEKER